MLPYLTGTRKTERDTVAFGGINYGEGAGEGELSESAGLSSASYPALSPRAPRKVEREYYQKPDAVFAWTKLVEVSGGLLKYDGRDMCTVTPGAKQFAVVANKLVVFPDMKVLDLTNLTVKDYGSPTKSEQGSVTTVTANSITLATSLTLGHGSGSCVSQSRVFMEAVLSHSAAEAWLETGEIPRVFGNGEHLGIWGNPGESMANWVGDQLAASKTDLGEYIPLKGDIDWDAESGGWDTSSKNWRGVPNTDGVYLYVTKSDGKIVDPLKAVVFEYDIRSDLENPPIFTGKFDVGDRVIVEIGGTEYKRVVASVSEQKLTFTENGLPAMVTQNVVTIKHDVPDLDFICAKDNRLWGVRSADQTIYVSALGKPMDFFDYSGEGNDSYAVAVGSAGEFTGMCAYSDSVLIWKENLLYKVLGSAPSEYRYYEYNVSGIQSGCNASQVVINEVLYFLGREGVYAYAGDVPQLVSMAFGERRFSDGRAGTDGQRYYISMRDDASGEWGLWCYDTLRGIWMREDNTAAAGFARLGKTLYMMSETDNRLYALNAGGDEVVSWSAEFAAWDETTLHRKRYTRITLRLELSAGAWVQVELNPDGRGWRHAYTTRRTERGTVNIPIAPMRCDRLKVRISGEGEVVLRGMERLFSVRSERG